MMELLKLLKCSLIVLFTIPSYSQTKRAIMEGTPATNNAIFIQTTTPRVGINISTPNYTLHINGNVNVDGNYLRYGIPITTGSYGGDNLGNHIATTTLNMSFNDITNVNHISASSVTATVQIGLPQTYLYGKGDNITNVVHPNDNTIFTGVNEFTKNTYFDNTLYVRTSTSNNNPSLQLTDNEPTITGIDFEAYPKNVLFNTGLQVNSSLDYAFNYVKLTTTNIDSYYFEASGPEARLSFDKYGLIISSGLRAGANPTNMAGGVNIINQNGKIPAISSTYFENLDGSNLQNIAILNATNTFSANQIFNNYSQFNSSVTIKKLKINTDTLEYNLDISGGQPPNIYISNNNANASTQKLAEIDFLQGGNGQFRIIPFGSSHDTYPDELQIGAVSTNANGGNIRLTHNGSSPTVYISSSGNVGIYKSSPTFKLDVSGDINFSGNLYKDGSLINVGADNLGNHIATQTLNMSNYSIINATYVGLVNNFDYPPVLDISGGSFPTLRFRSSSGGEDAIEFYHGTDSSPSFRLRSYSGGNYFYLQDNLYDVLLSADKNNNRVGIGLSVPSYTLDVNGVVRSTQMAVGSYIGKTAVCSSGQTLGGINIQGGIVVDGTCVSSSGGDAVLSATQTWTGINTFNNNTIFNSSITINANSSQKYALTIDSNSNSSDGYALTISTNGSINALFSNLGYTIVASSQILARQNSITISGFNIKRSQKCRLYFSIGNASGASAYVRIYLNGDTTTTNYWTQEGAFGGTAVGVARNNAPNIGYAGNAFNSEGYCDISYATNTGYYTWFCQARRDDTNALQELLYVGTSNNIKSSPISNIQIKLDNNGNFESGSYLELMCIGDWR